MFFPIAILFFTYTLSLFTNNIFVISTVQLDIIIRKGAACIFNPGGGRQEKGGERRKGRQKGMFTKNKLTFRSVYPHCIIICFYVIFTLLM